MKKTFVLFLFVCISSSIADVTNGFINTCGDVGYDRIYAIFSPIQIICEEGQFLPAASLTCATCPDGYNCDGGIFEFSMTNTGGLVIDNDNPYISYDIQNTCASNSGRYMNGTFSVNLYNCAPGYYLPADSESCEICPAGSYCVGGTYTFNENESQGIELCPDGMMSMAGAPACYPHILHIGGDIVYLKSTKQTVPSLNVGMDDEVFFANMTTVPTPMNSATDLYLKILVDGVIYYVCDDTVYKE